MGSQLNLIKKLHQKSPVPYAVTDNDFTVMWANDHALTRYPQLSLPGGLKLLLSSEQIDAFCEKKEPFVVPLAAMSHFAASFTPIDDGYLISFGFAEADSISPLLPQSVNYIIGAISSRLRLPLSNIFAEVSTLARREEIQNDAKLLELVDDINSNSYSMLRFTSDLTEYMKYMLGSEQTNLEYIDLNDFLRRFVTAVSVITESAGIPVISDLPSFPVMIKADQKALNYALLHIISNSCRFSRECSYVNIALDTDGASAKLTVTDKGLGIPSDILSKVCEPFFSFDHFGQPMAGCGLGLSIAHQAITRAGGSLAVSSVLDEGTTVAIRLPLAKYEGDIPLGSSVPAADMLRDRFSLMHIILSDSCGTPKP